jgi:hypothetical protein
MPVLHAIATAGRAIREITRWRGRCLPVRARRRAGKGVQSGPPHRQSTPRLPIAGAFASALARLAELQNPRQIPVQLDVERALVVRGQRDPLDVAADDLCRLGLDRRPPAPARAALTLPRTNRRPSHAAPAPPSVSPRHDHPNLRLPGLNCRPEFILGTGMISHCSGGSLTEAQRFLSRRRAWNESRKMPALLSWCRGSPACCWDRVARATDPGHQPRNALRARGRRQQPFAGHADLSFRSIARRHTPAPGPSWRRRHRRGRTEPERPLEGDALELAIT